MKPILYLSIFVLLFSSCKPSTAIITSKNEAVKKGIYVAPVAKKTSKKIETLSIQNKIKTIENNLIIKDTEEDYVLDSYKSSHLVEQLINTATSKLGTKYRSGGITDLGFDCSGLMFAIFNMNNIDIPRNSYNQSKLGVTVDKENCKKGDLIFFNTNGRGRINHVGLIVETTANEIKFIHASSSNGVIVSSTKDPYYQKNLAQINRVVE